MVKAKPNQKFHIDKLNTALNKLDQLEFKPVEELTLRESIYFLRGKLNSALKKGYTYEDLSEILAEQEILVSATTLKLYLTEGSKKSSSRKRKSKSSSASSSRSTPQSNSKLSTNVTDSKEELGTGNSDAEINSIKGSTDSEQAVNLNSTTRTKSSSSVSNKAKTKSQSIGNKSSLTKTKILSGSNDDLESEFNSF
ncbi:MAG TPA: hypothetical protein V6C71_27190 [Coleofasciculaceae cyanobacterium]|jgi:CCR4-NOT transcriptional regulation complex NOT5 subunit